MTDQVPKTVLTPQKKHNTLYRPFSHRVQDLLSGYKPTKRVVLYLGSLIRFRSKMCNCCSVTQLCPSLCGPHGLHHARLPCPSPTPGAHSNSCPSSQWCYPTISSSVIPFSYPQPFPASGTFLMSWLFGSGALSIGASSQASVLPNNIQGWFPLGWTGLTSLQSKGLSRVFSNTTVQRH